MSSLTAGWILSGASAQWKNAKPGKVFDALVNGDYANPVIVVDEIDKAGGDSQYDPLGSLYTLLEHDTACDFVDEFAEVPIDASDVVWIATANDAQYSGADPEPDERLCDRTSGSGRVTPDRAKHLRRAAPRACLGPCISRNAEQRKPRSTGAAEAARDAARAARGVRQRQARAATKCGPTISSKTAPPKKRGSASKALARVRDRCAVARALA